MILNSGQLRLLMVRNSSPVFGYNGKKVTLAHRNKPTYVTAEQTDGEQEQFLLFLSTDGVAKLTRLRNNFTRTMRITEIVTITEAVEVKEVK